jgi:orotidine-5'-phosphate decarboxylase
MSSPICLALDVPTLDEAKALATACAPHVGMFKIGLELFISEGPKCVSAIREIGLPIFLDLKLFDIPVTVNHAAKCAAASGASMITVHAAGGRDMMQAAIEGAGEGVGIIAVTVLTSMNDSDMHRVGIERPVIQQVRKLADLAKGTNVKGLVCAPVELKEMRGLFGPSLTYVTPGIRGDEPVSGDDQKRTMKVDEAIKAGANWLVVGRPIRDAKDPAAAAAHMSAAAAEAISKYRAPKA